MLIALFHPAARLEALEVVIHYARINEDLAWQFEQELSHVLTDICSQPLIHRVRFLDIRRTNLKRFPYCLFFRVSGQQLQVLAVAHAARRPSYWIDRIKSHPSS